MNISFDFLNNIQLDYNSPVILSYFLLSFIACILNSITRGKSNSLLFSSSRGSIWNPLTYLKLFTHSIGHKDWDHFIHNFLFILLIGPMIEEKYGSISLIIMLLATSFVIAIFNILFQNYLIIGASGNVYMLIVLSSFSNLSEGKIPITLLCILLFYVFSEVRKSILEGNKKVYHDGHLIGALCGILFGFFYLHFPDCSSLVSCLQDFLVLIR